MNKQTKHQFALFCDQLPQNAQNITLTNPELVQRISKVLRLQPEDTIILFDGAQVVDVRITIIDKKQVVCSIVSSQTINPLMPEIHCIVPVLKRDALEDVIYSAVELGATSIQLVFTEKIHRVWAGDKEFDRLHGIMIAACEQAKQFMVPLLHEPISFDEILSQLSGTVIFFDVDGLSLFEVITRLRKEKISSLTMLMGPEADLTENEKEALRAKGVIFCKLTPTILRAKQAFAVGLGMLRSIIQ